jgi:hypothetical protein
LETIMANDLVPSGSSSVEYYSPSSGRVVEVHHHHHHYVTVEQPKSDGGSITALKAIGGIVGGIGALFGGIAAINGANNGHTPQYVPQQQQTYQYQAPAYQAPRYVPPPPRCYTQQRSEYVGRILVGREYLGQEITYQERTPYGIRTHYRNVYRDHYRDQYRTYNVQVCD